ncbi:MAG: hypothetical protein GTN86_04375 [Xanthomonadales bacterium]|nr:hypothetical protein [Xanthomonadales bacterium]NIN59213.1 hypothetical protein [Xanthomonadales bacterium]NIN74564.1 hypothetical protein [Xanthomonadales bacterium]NIO13982.1 hypothetical protein [Xanthomonadales bacterium]NIP11606.1 hypothetical protein [Xanthomonadales bacterium]
MQQLFFEVNPQASLAVKQVGRARTPVIVIDDFAADPQPLIRYAAEQVSFGADDTSMYPGVRAALPRDYVITVLQQLQVLLRQVYRVPNELRMRPVNTVFSLITTPESDLSARQRSPHFDSNRPFYLALLHYLNEGGFCDTGLFRHLETGLERIIGDDVERYVRARELYREQHGPPDRAYVKGSNAEFELYERLEYRANRLAVYPGYLLHSGLVDPAVDIDPHPATGRLTANIFIDFFPAGGNR